MTLDEALARIADLEADIARRIQRERDVEPAAQALAARIADLEREVARLTEENEQERTRLWDAIIAVDAIEHTNSLANDGDLAERIERIGAELVARERIIEVYEAQLARREPERS